MGASVPLAPALRPAPVPTHTPTPCAQPWPFSCLQDLVLSTKTVSRAVPKNSETDVVMCAVKPTCVNRVVVELVILNLNPRRIFILAPASGM